MDAYRSKKGMLTNSYCKLWRYAYHLSPSPYNVSTNSYWKYYGDMPTISRDVLIKGVEGLLPIRHRSNGHVPTIFRHALIKRMEGFLPIRYGSNGNMLTMSCYFLMDMMKGCLPSHNRHNGDMLTISVNFLKKVVEECFQIRVIVL